VEFRPTVFRKLPVNSHTLLVSCLFPRSDLDPAAAFLHRLTEILELDDAEFIVDGMSYLTALARHNLSGHLDCNDRNYIEKWFQTVTMRIDRFHSIWMGSSASARRWLNRFKYHYNRQRSNQALDGQTPAEEVLN